MSVFFRATRADIGPQPGKMSEGMPVTFFPDRNDCQVLEPDERSGKFFDQIQDLRYGNAWPIFLSLEPY
jgi:hypothetical protein